jgi:hypothetical protein
VEQLNRAHNGLRALAAKLLRPFRIPVEILFADGRPRRLDGFDEVLDAQWRLDELVAVEVVPRHFFGFGVAGGAGRPFLLAFYCDLSRMSGIVSRS